MLKTAEIVSDESKNDEVGINNAVEIYFISDETTEKYKLVTSVRGNSLGGYISIESPLGKAIVGHKAGDVVTVKVNDSISYDVEIKSIDKSLDDENDSIRSF